MIQRTRLLLSALLSLAVLAPYSVPAADIPETVFAPYQTAGADYASWLHVTEHVLVVTSRVADVPGFGPVEYLLRGRGPVVLVLHGAFGGYDQSLLVGQHLLAQGFTVLAVSRPGYFRTPISVGKSISRQADAMVGLLNVLGIRQAAVLGFFAGCPVAVELALRHPSRVSSLILEGVGAHSDQAAEYQVMLAALRDFPPSAQNQASWAVDQLAHDQPAVALPFFFAFDSTLPPAAQQRREQYVLSHPAQLIFFKRLADSLAPLGLRRAGAIKDVEGLNPYPGLPLESIHAPTLIVQARNDNSGDYTEAQAIQARIAKARLLTVEDSGHFIWLGVHAQEWQSQVAAFLRQHPPR